MRNKYYLTPFTNFRNDLHLSIGLIGQSVISLEFICYNQYSQCKKAWPVFQRKFHTSLVFINAAKSLESKTIRRRGTKSCQQQSWSKRQSLTAWSWSTATRTTTLLLSWARSYLAFCNGEKWKKGIFSLNPPKMEVGKEIFPKWRIGNVVKRNLPKMKVL
jgi:hypothetical protein